MAKIYSITNGKRICQGKPQEGDFSEKLYPEGIFEEDFSIGNIEPELGELPSNNRDVYSSMMDRRRALLDGLQMLDF